MINNREVAVPALACNLASQLVAHDWDPTWHRLQRGRVCVVGEALRKQDEVVLVDNVLQVDAFYVTCF